MMARVQNGADPWAWTLAVLLAAAPALSTAQDGVPKAPAYNLTLSVKDTGTPSPADSAALYEKAIQLVRSSNDNSGDPRWRNEWGLVKILDKYRRSAGGDHLLISFKEPQQIDTVGGKTMVQEILIGLGNHNRAGPLHTVDDEGRVIAHTMYSGELCIEIAELVFRMNDT